MKIKKPEDEKYFKDVVLKDILTEISHETGAKINHNSAAKKRKKTKQKISSKLLFFIAGAILLVFFTLILFKYVREATVEEKPVPQTPTLTTTESKEESWKMPEDREAYKKPAPKKKVAHTPIKPIEIKAVKSKPKPKQMSERERAKEALRQQLLKSLSQ